MVIGNGLMAQAFKEYYLNDEVVIFASGVSNSTETNEKAFIRELNLLEKIILDYPKSKLVYFSTCSIEDESVKKNLYVKHKIKVEEYIAENCDSYIIFRVSNVVGKRGNANTLINYLVQAIQENKEITLWQKAERNIIDIEDVIFIANYVLNNDFNNETINIAFRKSFLVTDIVKLIEQFLSKKATINLIDKGNRLRIDTSKIAPALDTIETEKRANLQYISSLLKKYYA
ncbi:NAD-dependent epimerase/dehydratase family protein [Xanthomarina sp. F2636L]|uniref:NAD-dependent epimerase/dehydratase family protein n=1 Tax=Xanthomarina sp. F2636L TaxID=2996018 RepID=UPI00225E2EA1|nr:NAD-dependent epimerase/dehydratase family protein [Xanthomarina sp. F2636L]MCX7549363.1 NAD-dependent epimerase/dehydratase family protein [Xanthomarina sp. F2636L]